MSSAIDLRPHDLSPRDLLSLSRKDLRAEMARIGEAPYRADQVFTWLYKKGVRSFDAMSNLSADLRRKLPSHFRLTEVEPARVETARDESATKFLLRLPDGLAVESVLLRFPKKETICFSTQVGCAYGCTFCTTGLMGRLRNMTAGEIVSQILHVAAQRSEPERAFNLVAMGMGEPLDNYESLMGAVRILTDDFGPGIGPRRITVSTVGVVPGIRRLASEGLPLGLACSLNAPNDHLRDQLMPVNRKWPIGVLVEALRDYSRATGRRVTLEYVLMAGVNDTITHADQLAKIASSVPSKVNLIPVNPAPGLPYRRPSDSVLHAFVDYLYPRTPAVTVRQTKGDDIHAACGQLGFDQVRTRSD